MLELPSKNVRTTVDRTPKRNWEPWATCAASLFVLTLVQSVVIFGLRRAKEEVAPAVEQIRATARLSSETAGSASDILRSPARIRSQLDEIGSFVENPYE